MYAEKAMWMYHSHIQSKYLTVNHGYSDLVQQKTQENTQQIRI